MDDQATAGGWVTQSWLMSQPLDRVYCHRKNHDLMICWSVANAEGRPSYFHISAVKNYDLIP
jgi:hypothetical protein